MKGGGEGGQWLALLISVILPAAWSGISTRKARRLHELHVG